ncbi:hypothetical protein ACWD6I_15530 [Streptomyces sp. NPDC002454]
MTLLGFTTLPRPTGGGVLAVGTLGPHGTSSEVAATRFVRRAGGTTGRAGEVRLYDSYEEAGAAVRTGEVTHLVVANAYRAVNQFYMEPALELANVFVMDTPLYGLAAPRGAGPVPDSPTIASHPAPEPIIAQLLSPEHTTHTTIHSASTSAAARAAVEGTADLALTTAPCAELYGLEFISRTRPIRMVWSVFANAAAGRIAA